MKTLLFLAAATAIVCTSCGETNVTATPATETSTNDVIENILTRTSVRRFDATPIGTDTLETLLKAGMAAPTAINAQPWGFVLVTEREVLDSLISVHPYSNLETASAAIVVCGDMGKAIEGPKRDYWIQDCSAASENILLAAHAYGLGAVWCGVYPDADRIPDVKRVLNIPDSVMPLNIITIGHPAAPSTPKNKWNPDNIHRNRW